MIYYLIFAFVIGCWTETSAFTFPHCRLNDDLENCILKAANALKPRLRDGIKELGIPSYNPLVLSNFDVFQDTNLMNYSASLWNFTIKGMDDFHLTEISFDPKSMTFKAKFDFDALDISGVYSIKGRVLHIPVEGKGPFQGNFGQVDVTVDILGGTVARKDEEYYNLEGVKVGLSFGSMSVNLDGLFEQGPITNLMIDQSSKMIIDAATPVLEEVCERYIYRYFKWLTKRYAFYKLFLPTEHVSLNKIVE